MKFICRMYAQKPEDLIEKFQIINGRTGGKINDLTLVSSYKEGMNYPFNIALQDKYKVCMRHNYDEIPDIYVNESFIVYPHPNPREYSKWVCDLNINAPSINRLFDLVGCYNIVASNVSIEVLAMLMTDKPITLA